MSAPPAPESSPSSSSSSSSTAAAAAAAAAASSSSKPPASDSRPAPSDDLTATISDLEHGTWKALKKRGADLLPYLAADCTMQFPQGAYMSTRSEPSISDVLTADAYIPWKHYELEDIRVIPLGKEAAVISYRVAAWRGDDQLDALVGSVWKVEDGEWKLVFHQQTPF